MEKNTTLNQHQIDILDNITGDDFLSRTFYFSGGTALSEMYLHHRESIDLDFFSRTEFDPQSIFKRLTNWSKKLRFDIETEYIEPTHIYFLKFHDKQELKIDFAHYPYLQLESMNTLWNNLNVDSLRDIATNKLLTLTQRAEVKDFVDIYFLLQQFTFWELKDSVKIKFNIDIDPYIFSSDCMVVDEFEYMPKMLKTLNLSDLQSFFHKLSEKLGRQKTI